jgi:hypothetical protein
MMEQELKRQRQDEVITIDDSFQTAGSSSSSSSSSSASSRANASSRAVTAAVTAIVKKLEEHYECSICCCPMAFGHNISPCGCSFCYSCIADWGTNHKNCPLCQKTFSMKDSLPNRPIEGMIREILKTGNQPLLIS